jgi:signal transduction histidine kinase
MLDLSRVESGSFELHLEHVDLAQVAGSVLDEFHAQAQAKGVALVLEGGDGDTAWSDEQRLAQVLRALIDNAIKFSPPGSTVKVHAGADDSRATLVVSDNGPGIPEEELPHVFERFHRGRQERATTSGAGLGLSIARELTELLHGEIHAASQGGAGASFTVRLPRAPSRRAAAAPS